MLDELAADRLGIDLGATAHRAGHPVRVVGLSSSGGTSITNTTVFVTRGQFAAIRGDRRLLPAGRHQRLRRRRTPSPTLGRGPARQRPADPQQFASSEARIVTDMSADLLRLMSTIGLLIALAVIALGLITATLARLRDYAVLKALGASTRRLAGAMPSQVRGPSRSARRRHAGCAAAAGRCRRRPAVQIIHHRTAVAQTTARRSSSACSPPCGRCAASPPSTPPPPSGRPDDHR